MIGTGWVIRQAKYIAYGAAIVASYVVIAVGGVAAAKWIANQPILYLTLASVLGLVILYVIGNFFTTMFQYRREMND